MATCSEVGCTVTANSKVYDWRGRRPKQAPKVRPMCDYHAQPYAGRSGYSVRAWADRGTSVGVDGRELIRPMLRRLGKIK